MSGYDFVLIRRYLKFKKQVFRECLYKHLLGKILLATETFIQLCWTVVIAVVYKTSYYIEQL